MSSHQSLFHVGSVPYELDHVLASKEVLTFFNEFISTKLHILIKKVATEHLLSILVVNQIAREERQTQSHLSNKLKVLVVEEHIVIVQEDKCRNASKQQELFVVWIVHIQIGHIVVPLWIVRVKEHGVKWELRSNSFHNIEKIEHLFN